MRMEYGFLTLVFYRQGFEYVDANGVNGTIGSNGATAVGHPTMGMVGGILTREMHDNQGFEGKLFPQFISSA